MPYPLTLGLPFGPLPRRVDVLTGNESVPVAVGERARLEPAMNCTLQFAFLLTQDPERVILFVGPTAAFNMSFEDERPNVGHSLNQEATK